MKIIDLLNKIANGEEVPKKIKYDGQEWKYNPFNDYEGLKYGGCLLNQITLDRLNDKVEIIEEEKKIPEKLNNFTISVGRVDESNIEKYIQKLFDQQYEIFNKINSIIDYLKSKGDE